MTDAEYHDALRDKLREEVAEFEESGNVEELSDILEVVDALATLAGIQSEQLERIRQQKRQESCPDVMMMLKI